MSVNLISLSRTDSRGSLDGVRDISRTLDSSSLVFTTRARPDPIVWPFFPSMRSTSTPRTSHSHATPYATPSMSAPLAPPPAQLGLETNKYKYWARIAAFILGVFLPSLLVLIGFSSLSACPLQPWLPAWAVTCGVLCLLAAFASLVMRSQRTPNWRTELILHGVLCLPTALLYLLGCAMMLSVVQSVQFVEERDADYCNARLVRIVGVTLIVQPAIIGALGGRRKRRGCLLAGALCCGVCCLPCLHCLGLGADPAPPSTDPVDPCLRFDHLAAMQHEQHRLRQRGRELEMITIEDSLSPIEKLPQLPMVH